MSDIPNSETIKAIEDCQKSIGMSKLFNSVEELIEDLNTAVSAEDNEE